MKDHLFSLAIFILLFSCFSCEPTTEEQNNSTTNEDNTSTENTNNNTSAADMGKEYYSLDASLVRNNKIVNETNNTFMVAMENIASTKIQYRPILSLCTELRSISKQHYDYLEALKNRLAEESGGAISLEEAQNMGNADFAQKPREMNENKTAQRLFVDGRYPDGEKEAEGPILEKKILDLKKELMELTATLWENAGVVGTIFSDPSKKQAFLESLEEKLALSSSENHSSRNNDNKDWVAYNFGNKTAAAAYYSLSKLQNDVILSEYTLLQKLGENVGKMELNYDKFDVFSNSSKPYVLLGESYETEIALGAYSSQAKFTAKVDGASLSIEDGKAQYSTRPTSVGEKEFTTSISVINPLTGTIETFNKKFRYEVGQPSVNISADKMNVLYVGVDNPITIAAAGVSTSAMEVSMIGGSIKKVSGTSYIATVAKPGKVTISLKNTKNNKTFPFKFRVKRVPDPVVKMGTKTDGLMSSSEFKTQIGLAAFLFYFDFDAKCNIQSYTLYYTRKRQDPVEIQGRGGRFTGKILSAVKQAKPGSQYAFTNVKARCPGDKTDRRVNGLAFKIK